MKKVTYNIIKHIPLVEPVLVLIGQSPMLMCSPGLADGVYEPVLDYMKKHPDVLMTEKLGSDILAGKIE